jgi:hypothetical protein
VDKIKALFGVITGRFSSIVKAINEGAPLIFQLIRLYQESRHKGWVETQRKLALEIKEAKTDEERMALARRLFNARAQ